MFEKYLADGEQQRILNGMHEAYETTSGDDTPHAAQLDVPEIPLRQRHEMITQQLQRPEAR